MSLALAARQSVHGVMAMPVIWIVYVRRSQKGATDADISDEVQEAACRRIAPPGVRVRVISDSGGHNSGYSDDRDGYQALLAAIARGEVAGIVVYDLSRLARNSRLMQNLLFELERHRVALLVANMPGTSFDGAAGRFMFSQLCSTAEYQRNMDSERMVRMQRSLFEAGRHRGHDPLGYKSMREADGRLVHPRQLVIDDTEAIIVRRVFGELTHHSFNEVADILNQEGVEHEGPWTRDAVKDIFRRGRMYLGFVVEKRGREERPGQHDAILTDAEYTATMAAVAARRRVGNKPAPFRHYTLRGLVLCSCGTKMRGEAHVQRGGEIRYYRCPRLGCRTRRCPAELIERHVLDAIAEATLPRSVIDTARGQLTRRLQIPDVAASGRQKARLTTKLENLRKQHGWGDISDAEYQRLRDAVQAALRDLPDDDRIKSFDAYRARILELPAAIAVALPARRQELARIVVKNVVVNDRTVEGIEWTPPARPFFEKRQRACPQGCQSPGHRRQVIGDR